VNSLFAAILSASFHADCLEHPMCVSLQPIYVVFCSQWYWFAERKLKLMESYPFLKTPGDDRSEGCIWILGKGKMEAVW